MSWRLLVTDNRLDLSPAGCVLKLSSAGWREAPVQAGINIWTQHSEGMWGGEQGSIGALAISPNYATDSTIFAAISWPIPHWWGYGVFKSTDGGKSWNAMNAELTNLNIEALALTPTASLTLFAGTYRSSVWQYTMPELPCKTYLPFVMKNR